MLPAPEVLNGKLRLVGFQPQLMAYAGMVDRRLDAFLPPVSEEPSSLHEAMRYSALAPGKRLRPALTLASTLAVGGTEADSLDGACALELVHAFSLIHDDLPALDNDDLRRGRPTCHVKFGEAVAILAGDGLFSLAFELLSHVEADATRVVWAIRCLTHATGPKGLVGGETIDILSEGQPTSAKDLQLIHQRKTGALICASCEVGGILGGGSVDEIARLARFGNYVGLAFQIADDLLNETSTQEQLGKSAGSDRIRGKATYPLLYGLEASRRAASEAAEAGIAELSDLQNSGFLIELARYAVERLS